MSEKRASVFSRCSETPQKVRDIRCEVIMILICFHFNIYRNFKHYYL